VRNDLKLIITTNWKNTFLKVFEQVGMEHVFLCDALKNILEQSDQMIKVIIIIVSQRKLLVEISLNL
jgi:hypothetical protein